MKVIIDGKEVERPTDKIQVRGGGFGPVQETPQIFPGEKVLYQHGGPPIIVKEKEEKS